MTLWSFLDKALSTWPITALIVIACLYLLFNLSTKVIQWWLTRENPEVALRGDMAKLLKTEIELVKHYRLEVEKLERRTARLTIWIRALESAVEACARHCPDCRRFLEEEMDRARKQAIDAGFMREGDTTITGFGGEV